MATDEQKTSIMAKIAYLEGKVASLETLIEQMRAGYFSSIKRQSGLKTLLNQVLDYMQDQDREVSDSLNTAKTLDEIKQRALARSKK